MATTEKAIFEPIRSVAFGSITAAFLALGTPTVVSGRSVILNNLTNGIIQISLDGTNVHLQVGAGQAKALLVTGQGYSNRRLYLPQGTQFYVRYVGAAPGTQSFWIEVMGAMETT